VGSYYYLVAQLPGLIYDQQPLMSSEAFKELAKGFLSKHDATLLDKVSLDPFPPEQGGSYEEKAPSSGSSFIDAWREWERTLRLNLAKQRAFKIKRDAPVGVPSDPADAAAAAAKIMAVADEPLEGELLTLKVRWNVIETLQGLEYFHINTILAYLLKLLLLERHALFQTETGFAEYKSLYASIVGSTSPAGETK
jgi:hypothetical protein